MKLPSTNLQKRSCTAASSISKAMSDYESSLHLVEVEMAKCLANLENLRTKVEKPTKKRIDAIAKKIDEYQPERSKERAREIYNGLNGLIQVLDNLREDMKWSDVNG